MAVNFVPLYDRILLRRQDEPEPSSIIIRPDSAKEKPLRGEVVAVGSGRITEGTTSLASLTVKVGDVVVFDKYSGTDIKVDGEELFCIKETGILGILTKV